MLRIVECCVQWMIASCVLGMLWKDSRKHTKYLSAHKNTNFTKAFIEKDEWTQVRTMVNVVDMDVLFGTTKPSVGGTATPNSAQIGLQSVQNTCQVAGDGRYTQVLDCSGNIITRVLHPSTDFQDNTVEPVGVSDPPRRSRVVVQDLVKVSDLRDGPTVTSR